MRFINWDSTYSVEDTAIDKEHQHLFELINQFHEKILLGIRRDELEELFKNLFQYTVTHFKNEEQRMKEALFPNFEQHKLLHDSLISQLTNLNDRFVAGEDVISIDILIFLKQWITNHTLSADREYMPYVNSKTTAQLKVQSPINPLEALFQQKTLIASLEKRTHELEVLFEAIPDIYLHLDDRQIVRGYYAGKNNPLLKSISPSLSSETIIARDIKEIFPFDAYKKLKSYIEKVIEEKKSSVVIYSLAQNQHEFFHEARIICWHKNEVILIIHDVTEKIMKEKELEIQRTNALNNEKLAILGKMAAFITHEINNPCSIIYASIGLLKRKIQNQTLDLTTFGKDLDKINSATIRIAKIISGVRSYTRNAEADPLELCKLQDIINDALEFCLEPIRAQGVSLNTIFHSSDLKTNCRPVQISQVFVNLLNNAKDAIQNLSEKWIKFEISEMNNQIEISITDSGKGIPLEIQEKLMTPFFTTKGVDRGTGIGLSFSKGVIETHGGSMKIDNNCPNTRFVITLPKA